MQQGNGALPNQKPRTYDNQGMTTLGVTAHGSRSNQGTLTRSNNTSNFTNNASLAANNISCKFLCFFGGNCLAVIPDLHKS